MEAMWTVAGGSLLDLGCCLTALATWALGLAREVYAAGEMTPSGVNGQAAMVLTHDGRARSVLHTTLLTRTRPWRSSRARRRP
jgi:predicted dehydrogenase